MSPDESPPRLSMSQRRCSPQPRLAFIACLRETIAEITARGFADMPDADSSRHKSDKTSLSQRP
ncbi:hypothetical protein ACI2KH_24350 [Roseomonas mucosa]|uniref:hypothetical protein n=1 Tax=Roseomonas mucosa TaxID=207340 RepID=UPI003850648F